MPNLSWLSCTGRWLLIAALALVVAACDLNSRSGASDPEPPPPQDGIEREIAAGKVEGKKDDTNYAFLGIPYAKPPVGDLRFAPPQPAEAWGGRLDATEYGNICPQRQFTGTGGDEDCLYLNVFTPAESGGPYPVMVWIHGGGFVFGDGGPLYTPTRLVEQGVVVVTINYRLGILGLLAHEDLSAEQGGASGAYSLMDQQLALRWVRDNITAFHGDPDNVTIFGESAGGFSVLAHLASPTSKGLFHRAIVQSGSYQGNQTALENAEAQGAAWAAEFGCETDAVACLRAVDVDDILAAQRGLSTMTPTLHPDVLPNSINAAFAAGEFNQVPVLTGTNRDEWSFFLALGKEITETDYQRALDGIRTGLSQLIDHHPNSPYRLDNYDDFDNQAAALVTAVGTDAAFACPAMAQNALLAAHVPTYVYWFVDRDAPSPLPVAPAWLDLGATHAAEIQYLFGSDTRFAARGATEDQVQLAQTMTRFWTNFARSGDPNPEAKRVAWERYVDDPIVASVMSLDASGARRAPALRFATAHNCAFWAGVARLANQK